jgi:hypothetical protein
VRGCRKSYRSQDLDVEDHLQKIRIQIAGYVRNMLNVAEGIVRKDRSNGML